MNKKKTVFTLFVACLFVIMAPVLLRASFINRDSMIYASGLLIAAMVITALFLRFAGFTKKGKIITVCLACLVGLFVFNRPDTSVKARAAVHQRFPDIATWAIRCDPHDQAYRGRFTGQYLFYNQLDKYFDYDGITPDQVKNVAVIAFYAYSEPVKIGTYTVEGTDKKFADATVVNVTVKLVDASTKACFAEKTFGSGYQGKIDNASQAASGANHRSPEVYAFIKTYFAS